MDAGSLEEKYPYPTEFNVLDFVPKLSFEENYNNWKLLMWDFVDSQGLIGFIDGTTTAEESKAWKRSDNLVRRWILATLNEDTRLRLLSSKTARELFRRVENEFDATESESQPDEEMKDRQGHYLELQKAAIHGDWEAAITILVGDPDAVKTALALAASSASPGRNHFVRKLLEMMTPEDVLDLVAVQGSTALHNAARVGNVEVAEMLVSKNPHLPNVFDTLRRTPLHLAASTGNGAMVLFLKEVTSATILSGDDDVGASLLCDLTRAEFYDIAVDLLEQNPKLACMRPNPFDVIVEKRSSFRSGSRPLNFLDKLIYSAWKRLYFMIWKVVQNRGPRIKAIGDQKIRHRDILKLVKVLCKIVAESNLSTVTGIFKPSLHKAARLGIPEIIEEIIWSYPLGLYFVDTNNVNIFQYAVMYRQARVFNLIYQIDAGWRFINAVDKSLNNGLHFAARLGSEQQINLKSSAAGAVLQMQRELQWFKEVQTFSKPGDKERRNSDGMTPAEVFSDTHQDLVKEGERWMKGTAKSCTILAALVATMVFAAAMTVPGGYDPNDGHPFFSKRSAFAIFGIFDTLALFSSITYGIIFLVILTSRYGEEDFLRTIPTLLIIGLITLFVSILSTMIAFSAIVYLVFGDNNNDTWILFPLVALAAIPVAIFAALQFPLLIEMINSTYGQGIFGKKSNRRLG